MDFLEILKVIILGIVEGITEWLPVSSTGHMLLVDKLFTLNASSEFKDMFFVVIQLGAILAVVVMFWKKLFPWHRQKVVCSTGERTPDGMEICTTKNKIITDKNILKLWLKVIVACVPAAVIGLILEILHLEEHLEHPIIIALALIIYGVAFIIIERYNKKRTLPIKTTDDISYKKALIIGAFQVLSLIPGTSRSGATIIGALLIGIDRPAGAEFTFFLAIPVMLGASALKILIFIMDGSKLLDAEIGYLIIGMVVAFAVSLLSIKFLMNFVKKHSFSSFGWYRIGLGAVVLIVLVVLPLIFK